MFESKRILTAAVGTRCGNVSINALLNFSLWGVKCHYGTWRGSHEVSCNRFAPHRGHLVIKDQRCHVADLPSLEVIWIPKTRVTQSDRQKGGATPAWVGVRGPWKCPWLPCRTGSRRADRPPFCAWKTLWSASPHHSAGTPAPFHAYTFMVRRV